MTDTRFAAVILSAGFSSRMGDFKPLLDVGGKSLMERCVSLFRDCGVVEIHVVVGHRRDELSPLLETLGVRVVVSPDYRTGMYASVVAGVRGVSPECGAFFVLPVDIPLVRPHSVRQLMATHEQRPEAVLHPCFMGERGHPPLLPAASVTPILQWPGTGGLRGLLETGIAPSVAVDVVDRNILFDVDSPEDYRELLDRWYRRHLPAVEECEAVLGTLPKPVARHARQVAIAADRLGQALVHAGVPLDLDLVHAAALLHDMAKGETDHARTGGRRLAELGFPAVGEIVAAHTDIVLRENVDIDAAEVVYLADKYVRADRLVPLASRFDAAAERFGADPEALAAVLRRRRQAFAVRDRLERRLGRPPEQVLGIESVGAPSRETA